MVHRKDRFNGFDFYDQTALDLNIEPQFGIQQYAVIGNRKPDLPLALDFSLF